MHYKIAAALALLLGAASAATVAMGAQISAGQTYFERNCASCHTADAGMGSRAGPPLFNVVGRKAASAPGYNYTGALTNAGAAGKTWTRAELDVFLRDPAKDVPGTAMPIGIVPPAMATITPVMMVVIHGVRNLGWILATTGGSSPSFDIE